MDIQDRCKDSNALAVTSELFEFPTNTYYPPGWLLKSLKNYNDIVSRDCLRPKLLL